MLDTWYEELVLRINRGISWENGVIPKRASDTLSPYIIAPRSLDRRKARAPTATVYQLLKSLGEKYNDVERHLEYTPLLVLYVITNSLGVIRVKMRYFEVKQGNRKN